MPLCGQDVLSVRDCSPKSGNQFALWVINWHSAADFLHSYDSGSSLKTLKSRVFSGLREWLAICIRDSASAKTFGCDGTIPLIRTAVKLRQISVSHPFIGEGGFNVSTLRTSHGGTRCHSSYPASRSFCFLSLSGNRSSQRALSPMAPSLRRGRTGFRRSG
jgi:hypothetical protein